MKKKVLISIVAFALFAVAIASNSQNNKNEYLTLKNQEALAGVGNVEGLEGEVSCRCQWFGDDCRANGWGQICTSGSNCSAWDKNCG